MSYIREKKDYKTGYQESSYYNDKIQLNNDFIMVYGFNDLEERVKSFADSKSEIAFMTGASWGDYEDFFLENGVYNENYHIFGQQRKDGSHVDHGNVPYIVPNGSYQEYLINKLKNVIDLNITNIFIEEPEFWSFSGFSEGFKMQYKLFYNEEYSEIIYDKLYKASYLKAKLYFEMLDNIAHYLKEYGYMKGMDVKIYIPTHSLLNYSQWKICSPESMLSKSKYIDGFIAQVWTGTSRERNIYHNEVKERVFDTAFLEYSIMQQLVYGTNKRMWFLNDPIEDNPTYSWSDYKQSYIQTLVAALLNEGINDYEICPWPNRVFNRKMPVMDEGFVLQNQSALPTYIPKDYDTLLNNVFQMLGDMPKGKVAQKDLGVLFSDTAMYQRIYLNGSEKGDLTFPSFYGLSLPLLKSGLEFDLLALENSTSDMNYLKNYKCLVLSYEYMKPLTIEANYSLYRYVNQGGFLIIVDDKSCEYNNIDQWWKEYNSPVDHLLGLIKHYSNNYIYIKESPCKYCNNIELSQKYVQIVYDTLKSLGSHQIIKNYYRTKRGDYIITAMLEEADETPFTIPGVYVDMLSTNFEVLQNVVLKAGDYSVLRETQNMDEGSIVGTTARINYINILDNCIIINVDCKKNIQINIRMKVNKNYRYYFNNTECIVCKKTETILISFISDELNMTIYVGVEK